MLVCKLKKAEEHTKDTNGKIRRKDTSQTFRIYMDDKVLLGMNKGPEEMAKEEIRIIF